MHHSDKWYHDLGVKMGHPDHVTVAEIRQQEREDEAERRGTERVLTARKDPNGWLFVSLTQDGHTGHVAISDPEVQYELLSVVRDDGPREFILSY